MFNKIIQIDYFVFIQKKINLNPNNENPEIATAFIKFEF